MAEADIFVPHDEVGSIVSQPSARDPGTPARAVNALTVAGAAIAASPFLNEDSMARATSPTACAVPKRPAWPAAPPSAQQFSSCTSPTRRRPRHGSISVGAVPARTLAGGLKSSGDEVSDLVTAVACA